MNGKTTLWNKPLAASHVAMIVLSAIAAAAVAAAVFLYALPVQTEVLDAKAALEARQGELAAVQQQYTLERVDREQVEQLLVRMPAERTDSSYLAQLNVLAEQHQVTLVSFAASAAGTGGGEQEGTDGLAGAPASELDQMALTVHMIGRLPALQQYLAALHDADPYYAVTQWSIGQADSAAAARFAGAAAGNAEANPPLNAAVMSMNMTIETYLSPQYAHLLQAE